MCAEEAEIVFVSSSGGVDAGDCPKAAPCRTLEFGLGKISPTRQVMRLEGGAMFVLTTALNISKPVYVDGTDNGIHLAAMGPALKIAGGGNNVTLGQVTISAETGRGVDVVATSRLRLFSVRSGGVLVDGAFEAIGSTLDGVKCTAGSTSIVSSVVVGGASFLGASKAVDSKNCQLTVQRTLFNNTGGSLIVNGGVAVIENNVIVESEGFTDSMNVTQVSAGSTVRFNTFVNKTVVTSDGVALGCDGTVNVSSNIFAYNSKHPMGPPSNIGLCAATHSLFDTAAVPEHTAGEGNAVADANLFFLDREADDFRLSDSSPAKEASAPGLEIRSDFNGDVRPQPAATLPDVGAFEAL